MPGVAGALDGDQIFRRDPMREAPPEFDGLAPRVGLA